MDSEIVDAVLDWDSTSFSGGYEGLQELADGEFSGAVTEGTAWAFMLNGRVVGIEDGTMSMFEQAAGTAYTAPTPALPLLYVMQTRGEKQTQYYTNEKPISEADSTLASGGFTGYIELSENVLSGDYYTVYYGGKSMSVAFVGNSRKLLTDEEAFERADDEVGIYTVYAADLEVIDIPEPAGGSETTDQTATGATSDEPVDEPANETPTETESSDSEAPGTATTDSQSQSTAETPPVADGATPKTEESAPTATDSSPVADDGPTAGEREPADSQSASSARSQPTASTPTDSSGTAATQSDHPATATTESAQSAQSPPSSSDVFSDEAQWRDSKTIPSLDPSDDPKQASGGNRSKQSTKQRSSTGSLSRTQLQKRLKRAEQIMQKAESQHNQLIAERDSIKAERDEARQELETVRAKLSEAEAEIERLESQLESGVVSEASNATGGGQSMSTTEALQGTNLLVRYASKGEGTLEDAISGSVDQKTITSNLRIEPHTTFDRQQVSVDGQPFESFLKGRIELAFVRWLTEEFLFEIQQTGNTTHLKGIYEALPAINRAELRGSISLGTVDNDEAGEEPTERTATFDLVVRDKRDRPLFVADFNESKQPVGGTMVDSLVQDGSDIFKRNDSFAAAFAVTTSYYEGAALDAAADATGGGLLSASRGKSFVYISRKQGFHLCLIERLGDTFDLHVPEL